MALITDKMQFVIDHQTSSGEVSPVSITPSTTPIGATHAPKYGTVIPNRIFVGGIVANTTEQELKQFFSSFGAVKDTKIIADRAGVSKGYGFVTFETQEDADKIIKKEQTDSLMFKDRKLNIGPAIRKQTFPRLLDPSLSPGPVMLANGVPYTYQNGMAFFQPPETAGAYPSIPAHTAAAHMAQIQQGLSLQTTSPVAQHTYPVAMMPHGQAMYVPQSYTYQTAASSAPAAQWAAQAQYMRWAPQTTATAAATQYMYPTMHAVAPEMYAAQPHPGYQPADLEAASMIEAAPAEGSVVMESSMAQQRHYVESQHRCIETAPAVTTYVTNTPVTQQELPPPQAPPAVNPVMHVRTPVAYKRPLPTSAHKMMGTPTIALSPRATPTPPAKIIVGPGQRLLAKPHYRDTEYYEHHEYANSGPLTPPPTPEVTSLRS